MLHLLSHVLYDHIKGKGTAKTETQLNILLQILVSESLEKLQNYRSPRSKEQWEQIKTRERAGKPTRETLLDGIPESLPALLRAARIGARTANVGFDWDQAGEVLKKVDEEVTELKEAMAAADADHIEEELGDLLFTVANLARKLRIDPESALRAANNKFTRRFRAVEQRLTADGRSLHDATSDELEREWQAVKRTSPAGPTLDTP